ncbi:MAG: GNAT family N-acetyltransferase [Nocardioides sp.]
MAEVGDDLVPAGIARCVRYPEQPEAADVAVTVKDLWHGHGVATALLEELMQQRPAGITHLLTEVAADNPASLAMLRRLGPTKVLDTGMGILDVEVDLLSSGRFLTAEEADDRLHAVLADPERRTLRVRDRVCPWLKPDAAEERGSVEARSRSQPARRPSEPARSLGRSCQCGCQASVSAARSATRGGSSPAARCCKVTFSKTSLSAARAAIQTCWRTWAEPAYSTDSGRSP